MKCPLCKQECNKEDLITFLDYADYLFSLLCVETVRNFERRNDIKGALDLSMENLEQLRKCCETISNYAYLFDRSVYRHLATPQKEEQPND